MAYEIGQPAHSTPAPARQWKRRPVVLGLLCGATLGASTLPPVSATTIAEASGPWKTVKESDGITVSTRARTSSTFAEVRGQVEYDAPPEAFVPLFRDAGGFSSWLAECKESSAVGTKQGLNDFHVHAVVGIPWPFEDRDTVVKVKIRKLQAPRKGFVVFLRSMGDDLVPVRKGQVRMKTLEGRWVLEATEGGKTRAEFRFFIEPSGSLSPVFVNSTASSIQYKTLRNVRERLHKITRPQGDVDVPELGLLDPAIDD